jgi:formylglycine-generating enzyme required for sulfatase activity
VTIEAMASITAGEFLMGSNDHYPEEAPARRVTVDAFQIDRFQTTNREFAAFVADTQYVTVAERPLDPREFPGAPPENLVPGSLVFTMTSGPVDLLNINEWWTWTPGACWMRPDGPGSSLEGREEEPVVQVAHEDAEAYAAWAGKSLPTEAEWERAARAGLEAESYVWGDEPEGSEERRANYWHGDFPWRNDDGYGARAPVGSYPANGYGLHDMAGNVWEWTSDWYVSRPTDDAGAPCCVPANPRGGRLEESYDPAQPQFPIPRKVIKGGSYLCADSYCMRYRPAARRPQMIDTGMSHIGFRCIVRPSPAAGSNQVD